MRWQEYGINQMRAQSHLNAVQADQGTVKDGFNNTLEAALRAPDDATTNGLLTSFGAMADSYVAKGSITPAQAVNMKQGLAERYAKRKAETILNTNPALAARLLSPDAPNMPAGMSPDLGAAIHKASMTENVPEDWLAKTAQVESAGGRNMGPSSAGAMGPFQFMPGTATQYGVGNPMDNDQSAQGAARLYNDNKASLQTSLGRDPTGGELYLAHQQGAVAASALLRNPDSNAVDVLTPYYKNRQTAISAITGNGGKADMSAGDFAKMWTDRFNGAPGAPKSTAPLVIGDSLAVGIGQSTGWDQKAQQGAAPQAVLRTIASTPADQIKGRDIVLSGGVSSNPGQLSLVNDPDQRTPAEGRGEDITLVGVGNRADLTTLNDKLAAMAQDAGVKFTGALDPATMGPDGVHPQSYAGLASQTYQGKHPTAQSSSLDNQGAVTFPQHGDWRDYLSPDYRAELWRKAVDYSQAQNSMARSDLQRSIPDIQASLLDGQDTAIPEAQIRSLFPPDQAARVMEDLTVAKGAGKLFTTVRWATPDDMAKVQQDLSSGMGSVSSMLRGARTGMTTPGQAQSGTDQDTPEAYRLRQRVLGTFMELAEKRNAQLAKDPAAYVANEPTVMQASQAAANAQTDADKTVAGLRYVSASLAMQDAQVPEQSQHILTAAQATDLTGKLEHADPTKDDIGAQLSSTANVRGHVAQGVQGPRDAREAPRRLSGLLAAMPDPVARVDFRASIGGIRNERRSGQAAGGCAARSGQADRRRAGRQDIRLPSHRRHPRADRQHRPDLYREGQHQDAGLLLRYAIGRWHRRARQGDRCRPEQQIRFLRDHAGAQARLAPSRLLPRTLWPA